MAQSPPPKAPPPQNADSDKALLLPSLTVAVFATSPDIRSVMDLTARDRRLARADWRTHDGTIEHATAKYEHDPSPNLLIIESSADSQTLLTQLDRLAEECLPGTKVIVVTHANDVDLFRALLRQGVSDMLVAPLSSQQIIRAIQGLFETESQPRLGRVTAFIGARGGVGSSTVAQNVAVSIAENLDTDVVLADLDLQFGTVGLHFDIEGDYSMNAVLDSAQRLDDVLLERLALSYSERLMLLAAEPTLERNPDQQEEGVEKLIEVAQSSARHVILDLPRLWTARTKAALTNVDDIVITATPDLASLRNVKLMSEFLRQARPNDPLPHLVLNQVGQPKRTEIKAGEFAAAVRLDHDMSISFNARLFGDAVNQGNVIANIAPRSTAAGQFLEIGRRVNGQRKARGKRNLRRMLRRFWKYH